MKLLPARLIHYLPALATVLVCAALYTAAAIAFHDQGFFTLDVFIGFFRDQAVLGIAALGTTMVLLSGGIDLSVGSVVGCAGIAVAVLIENLHIQPFVAIAIVLVGGAILGASMGALIHFFTLTPFLVTLGGLFVVRGAALLISSQSVSITHPLYDTLTSMAIPLPHGEQLPLTAAIFLAVTLILIILSLQTPWGRNIYAIGGSEASALLMGLSVGRTKIAVYAVGGLCSALAGVVNTLGTSSGNATAATGMELDAIAAAVVGGTLLSGGVGSVAGTPVGVLTFGIIQTAINFQGTLSSWWTRIAIGGLLLLFVVFQRLVQSTGKR